MIIKFIKELKQKNLAWSFAHFFAVQFWIECRLFVIKLFRYHMVASVQFGIPYTYAMLSYTKKIQDKKKKLRVALKVGNTFYVLRDI